MNNKMINAKDINAKFIGGFTIVEMLLYMALMIIFTGVMVSIFVSIMKSQVNTQLVTSNEYDSRFIVQRMFYDFSNSTNLDTTIARYSLSDTTLLLDGVPLNSPDTVVENFSMIKVTDTVQVKFTMNGKNYQTTFTKRP